MCHPAFFLLSVLSSLSAGRFEKTHSIVWHHWHDARSPQKSGNMDFFRVFEAVKWYIFLGLQKIGVGHLDRTKHPSHRGFTLASGVIGGFVLAANSCHQFPWAKFPGWELSFRRKVKKRGAFSFSPPPTSISKNATRKRAMGSHDVTLFFTFFSWGGVGKLSCLVLVAKRGVKRLGLL